MTEKLEHEEIRDVGGYLVTKSLIVMSRSLNMILIHLRIRIRSDALNNFLKFTLTDTLKHKNYTKS